MPPAGLEPKFSVGERPQTYALHSAVNAIDISTIRNKKFLYSLKPKTKYENIILYNTIFRLFYFVI